MKKLVKLAGALAVVAVFAVSAVSTSNAQVSMDDVSVTTAENLDIEMRDTWALVSKDYVLFGTTE